MAPPAPSAPAPRRGPPVAPRAALAAVAALAALAGCSDPVPPPAQGAVSFDMGGSGCPVSSSAADLHLGQVSPTATSPLVDGETGTVSCRVAPKSGGFEVRLQVGFGLDEGFNLNGLVVPGQTTDVFVSLRTAQTKSNYQSAPVGGCPNVDCGQPCRVSFPAAADPSAPATIGVSAGRIWAAVDCPTLLDPNSGDAGAVCSIPSFSGVPGYFAFENCDES